MTTASAATAATSAHHGTGARRLRVLFVCYHFPPMTTTGSLRVTRFARDLPDDVEIDVLTVSNPSVSLDNTALFDQIAERVTVHRTAEISWLTGEALGRRFDRHPRGLPARAVAKIVKTTLSLFAWIPDRHVAWYPGAVAKGHELMQRRAYDLVFCSSPPHSLHLVGRALKRRHGVPLVVDFRDPWSHNPQRRWPSAVHRRLEEALEARLLRDADAVIANTPGNKRMWLDGFEGLDPDKVFVITNGYDPARRALIDAARRELPADDDPRPHLLYTGHLYDGGDAALRAYLRLVRRDPSWTRRLRVTFVGSLDPGVAAIADELEALGALERHPPCPAHELPAWMARADALLYVVPPNGWHWIPSKVYDYLLLERPIISVLPRGDAWNLLEASGLGVLIEDDRSADGVAPELERVLTALCDGTLRVAPRAAAIERYDGRSLTRQLDGVFRWALARAGRH